MRAKGSWIVPAGSLVVVVAAGLFVSALQSGPPTGEFPGAPPPRTAGGTVQADDELPGSRPYYSSRPAPASQESPSTATTQQSDTSPSRPQPQADRRRTAVITMDGQHYPLRTYKPLATPNDPAAAQWWVTETKLTQAWDAPSGSYQPLVAVIDTGFGLAHEEFAGRWHVNSGESGASSSEGPSQLNCSDRGLPLNANCNLIDDDADGTIDNENWAVVYQNPSRLNCSAQSRPITKDCNRLDDDNNGLIDDTTGWDFANNDNRPQAGELNPTGSGTTHGTRVAGIAAATGNNGTGIAGVDWHSRILPIQALDDDSYGDTLGVGRAIAYAVAQGADIISLSLGSDLSDDYVRQAVRNATAAGSVVVAASGNDGCTCISYPANYPEVLAVGALDTNRARASFTSYGSNLDILAPGTSMTTSSWSAGNPTAAYASGVNGTSFATPLVSGILARMLAQRPEATPLQLIAGLTENSDRLGLASATARSDTLGFGTAEANAAIQRMIVPRNQPQAYSFTPVSSGNKLNPAQAAEISGTYRAQQCAAGLPGTTPIYEMTKAGSAFYTISPTERWLAGLSGYSTSTFAYACLHQPHDTAQTVRQLNVFKEFRNILREQALP